VVAERIFSPCYIGGWSACAHWDLTEQTFRTVAGLFTARRSVTRDVEIPGHPFHLTVRETTRCLARAGVAGRTACACRTRRAPSSISLMTRDSRWVYGPSPTYSKSTFTVNTATTASSLDYGDRLANRAVFRRSAISWNTQAWDAPELVAACLDRRQQRASRARSVREGSWAHRPSVGDSGSTFASERQEGW